MADAPRRVKSDNPPADAGFSEHVLWERPDGSVLEKKPNTHDWTPAPAAASAPAPAASPTPAAPDARVTQTKSGATNYFEAGDRKRQESTQRAVDDAETRLKVQPWMAVQPKSGLSLGDTAEVSRLMRDENLSKEEAQRKVRWKKDMMAAGNPTAEKGSDAMVSPRR